MAWSGGPGPYRRHVCTDLGHVVPRVNAGGAATTLRPSLFFGTFLSLLRFFLQGTAGDTFIHSGPSRIIFQSFPWWLVGTNHPLLQQCWGVQRCGTVARGRVWPRGDLAELEWCHAANVLHYRLKKQPKTSTRKMTVQARETLHCTFCHWKTLGNEPSLFSCPTSCARRSGRTDFLDRQVLEF